MRRMLNTLYVMSGDGILRKEGETLLLERPGVQPFRVPIINLESVICFGNTSCTTPVLAFCAKTGISISWLTETGRYMGTFHGPITGNILLRKEQYRRAGDAVQAARIAQSIVTGKILNSRAVMLRAARQSEGDTQERLQRCASELQRSLEILKRPQTLEALRGIEGDAARSYFQCVDDMILVNKSEMGFSHRNRRPPLDPTNAALSFVYTLLMHDVSSALQAVGLDPAAGYLHADRPGRHGLALDLMEELRAYLADRLVLTLINRQQLRPEHFVHTQSGAVTMEEEARRLVVATYQERKQEQLEHPFIHEKVEIGLVPFVQAQLLARHLRGDLDGYPPFLVK